MSEALKHALVIAAHEELHSVGAEPNTSKVAAVTGIHRRDVIRLGSQPTPKIGSMNIVAKILGQWEHDKRFSSRGRMKELPISGSRGSFQQLVTSVSQDLNPATILAELFRLGFAEEQDGVVIPKSVAVTHSRASLEDAVRMLSYNLRGLCEAVDKNIVDRQQVPHLHVATTYDNLSLSYLPQIRQWILNEGSAFHKRLREYLASFDKDINPTLARDEGGGKVVVGSFSFTEEPVSGFDAQQQGVG